MVNAMTRETKDTKETIITITSGTMLKGILLILLALGIYYLWDIVLVLLMAVVIASAAEPAIRWFKYYHVPRLPSALMIYAGSMLLFAGLFYFFIPPIINDTGDFLSTLPSNLNITTILGPIAEKGPSILQPGISVLSENLSPAEITEALRGVVGSATGSFFNVVSFVFGGLMSLVLIVVLSFYLSVQEDGVANFLRIVTPVEHEKYVIDLWKRSQQKIGRWMQGQLVLALIVGVLVYLGLTILGVKYALILALFAGIFEIIPIFGPILAAIPGITIAFVHGGFTFMLVVAGFYIIVQQFENQLIYPLVVRKVVGVPPLLVIIALIVGARFAGFLGLLLSVPLAAALREYINDREKKKAEELRRLSAG